MKKIIKWTIVVCLSLILLAAAAWTFKILKEPFLRQVMVEWVQSLFASTTPDWKTYQSPDGGLRLDCPFPIKWENKEKTNEKTGKGFQSIYGRSMLNRTGFFIATSSMTFINFKSNPSTITLEGKTTEDIIKESLQSYPKFQWKDQTVICSGMPATLATYSYEMNGKPQHWKDLLINNKTQSWRISTCSEQKDTSIFDEWSKRVIESVKIESKEP